MTQSLQTDEKDEAARTHLNLLWLFAGHAERCFHTWKSHFQELEFK